MPFRFPMTLGHIVRRSIGSRQLTMVDVYRWRMPRWLLLLLGLTLIGCSVSSGREGSLPDGTTYVLNGADVRREKVTGVQAVIIVDLPNGTSPAPWASPTS